MIKIEIKQNDSGQRLDRFLRKYFRNATLSYIYKLIRTKVKINGKRVSQSYRLKNGDIIDVNISEEEFEKYLDQKSPKSRSRHLSKDLFKTNLKIVYEDENIIVVDKPGGLLTHETRDEKEQTLTNQVLFYLVDSNKYKPKEEKVFVPAPANRLDRNTSGLVVFGKNAGALRSLTKMFRTGTAVERYYLALVHGKMCKEKYADLKLQRIDEKSGKDMETHVNVLQNKLKFLSGNEEFTLVEAMLVTGRTHQIRIQLALEGYPVAGDRRYGKKLGKKNDYKLYLHGWKLIFRDCPKPLEYLKDKEITTESPLEKWLA